MKRASLAAMGLMAALATGGTSRADFQVFSGSGANASTTFNAFRAAAGSNSSRITWDGVRLDGTDANPNTQVIVNNSTVAIPVDRFANVGAHFADPYAVSNDGFAAVNPDTAGQFPAFSPNNTFVMFDQDPNAFDDRFIEQSFVLPGTTTEAGSRGFGAIFRDVELANSSTIEYFGRDASGNSVSLGKFAVPVDVDTGVSFLGVLFDSAIVAEVTLTVGTNALFNFDGTTFHSFGPENLAGGVDLVATDDFVFARPTALQTVPEPSTMVLLGLGSLTCLASRRLGRGRSA